MLEFRFSLLGEKEHEFYVAQFEPKEEVEKNIKLFSVKKEQLENLPEWNWCGICSLIMILKNVGINHPPITKIYHEAYDFGVYKLIDGKVIGAYHAELARYIEEKYNLKSCAIRNVDVKKLKKIILDNNFFIASVSPEIRHAPQKSSVKNGHLVLVFGVLEVNNITKFIFHNSTGFLSNNTQCSVELHADLFQEYFSGCGIIVKILK